MKSETATAPPDEHSPKRDVEHVREAAQTPVRAPIDKTGAKWSRARDAVGAKARAFESSVSGHARDVARDARELAGRGRRLVRHHPWTSIALGAGIGLLVGLLVRRR